LQYLSKTTINSHQTCCCWCNNIYTSEGAYLNHIEKKHLEHAQRTFSPLVHRPPYTTGIPPEPKEQNTAKESTSTPIQDLELKYSDLSEAAIEVAELTGIQELYLYWLPTNNDIEAECDYTMEPIA